VNIVVLDGYTLNPGDLSWQGLEKYGNLKVYDRTPKELILERSKDAEIIYTNKTPLEEADIQQLPKLEFIGVLATGYDVVDVEYASREKIVVTNVPTYGTNSVAQMVFALLLEMCSHVQKHSTLVREQDAWSQSKDCCFSIYPLMELDGKSMGIFGFGRIGRKTAQIAKAFGMKVLAYDPHGIRNPSPDYHYVGLDELFAESDVISLHAPLTPETEGIICQANLNKMKKSAILINTARGKLVVERDLAEALNSGKIAGACLDVLSEEPPPPENPLLHAKNCIITPHISWATKEARSRLMNFAADNLKAFLDGNPTNVVN